jgi:hypothetical protein
MSSVTSWSLNLPKSLTLVQPESMSRARTAKQGALLSHRQRALGGMAKTRSAPPHPAAAAVVRRRVRMGLGLLSARIGVALNPDDRQNNDRSRLIRRIAAEAHNSPVVRKFNNVAHQPLSSAAGMEAFCPDTRKSASP